MHKYLNILNCFISFSCLAGADFNPLGSTSFIFSVGGPTTNCIDFNIIDDEELEGDHDFTVEITDISSMSPHATISSFSITVVTITDNEGKNNPTVQVKEELKQ